MGPGASLVMDRRESAFEGTTMAEEEPLLVSPPTQDVAAHVRDYTRFIQMLKWSAIICLVIAFVVLLILK